VSWLSAYFLQVTANFLVLCHRHSSYYRECYREYVRTQILDGPSCILMRCPQHKCLQRISMNVVRLLLLANTPTTSLSSGQPAALISADNNGPTSQSLSSLLTGAPITGANGDASYSNVSDHREVYEKYLMYLTRNYIETSRTMKYCPSPNCNKVAIIG
jgi:hypothetical protein